MAKEIGPKELERRRQREAQAADGLLPHERGAKARPISMAAVKAEMVAAAERGATVGFSRSLQSKRDRNDYQRELMRKRRAEDKARKSRADPG